MFPAGSDLRNLGSVNASRELVPAALVGWGSIDWIDLYDQKKVGTLIW
ncbi:hypothetical protein [Synechococcus sp. A15-60]|nr:hypothetical protein [Synechococcus sp. A15-60]QNI49080.1 hypothetical protein SynA1560_02437 [Synechococcus sp. A15-60]